MCVRGCAFVDLSSDAENAGSQILRFVRLNFDATTRCGGFAGYIGFEIYLPSRFVNQAFNYANVGSSGKFRS